MRNLNTECFLACGKSIRVPVHNDNEVLQLTAGWRDERTRNEEEGRICDRAAG